MKKNSNRFTIVIVAVACMLLGGFYYWWFLQTHVKGWDAEVYESEAAQENPSLAAMRLLQKSGLIAADKPSLSAAMTDGMKAGVIVVSSRDVLLPREQGQRLLEWVDQGGVLILPAMQREDDTKISDPLLDATHTFSSQLKPKEAVANSSVTPPGAAYPLRIANMPYSYSPVLSLVGKHKPILVLRRTKDHAGQDEAEVEWSDDKSSLLQAISYGDGHIILTTFDRFDNANLRQLDHAELLLALVKLGDPSRPVWFVRKLDVASWYQFAWQHAAIAICMSALLILLALWRALIRFGPVLPEPKLDRRSLMEHIDASARWLWLRQAGRHALLNAVRQSALTYMDRRQPGLRRLGPSELANRVAARTNMPIREVELAMNDTPSLRPVDFVRQIQLLLQLRKHYER